MLGVRHRHSAQRGVAARCGLGASVEARLGFVNYSDDPSGYEALLRAKLTPHRIRSTMAFAALYQMTHEMIRHAVLDEVEQFFVIPIDGQFRVDEERYARDVLSRHKGRFKASLDWLVAMGAMTVEQADRIERINTHRNQLTHEPVRYIVDPDAEPDVDAFTDAVAILRSIRRFWTGIEADYGTYEDYPDVDLDEIVPLSMMVLQQCLDAYLEGLGAADDK